MSRRHWPLALWYACHFAAVGLLLPYLAPWLEEAGHSAFRIGLVFAVLGVTAVVAPNAWGWLADHTGRRLRLIRFSTACAALCFALVALAPGYWLLLAGMALFGCFRNAALPQFEALTFEHLGEQRRRYGEIRLWGSVGFIIAVLGAGAWLEGGGLALFPVLMLAGLAAIWLAGMMVQEPFVPPRSAGVNPLGPILRRPEAWILLLVSFLQQASHGPFYAFYSIHLAHAGYGAGAIGQLWALGVLAEIVIFVLMPRLLGRYAARELIMLALALTALRWVITGWLVQDLGAMVFAQLLHAASFGVFHAAAIDRIHRLFEGRARGRGQALYSSLSFGAGVAFGSFMAGAGWDRIGPGWTFSAAALCALLALALASALRESDGHPAPGRP